METQVGTTRFRIDARDRRRTRHGNITLEQLATHTSGLPRLAPNQPTGEANPYRDFTAGLAEEGLRAATRMPGTCTRTSGISSPGLR